MADSMIWKHPSRPPLPKKNKNKKYSYQISVVNGNSVLGCQMSVICGLHAA